jgi:Cu2+-containing amine oxidase
VPDLYCPSWPNRLLLLCLLSYYVIRYDVSGTIHDHMLNWKVDLDIAGTSNSIRMDNIVQEERKDDDG